MARRRPSFWTLLAIGHLLSVSAHAADRVFNVLPLTPIYRIELPAAGQRLATKAQVDLQKLPLGPIAFYALVTNEWLAGLAPVFAIERTNRLELRRRPPRGQENFSEPFFFALPPDEEPEAPKLTGRWDCRATREGSKPYVAMELTIEGERVSGRFDQNTDYRFAFITAGSFKSNWINLRIEYIQDAYAMIGYWNNGILKGTWRRTDDSEKGTWEAIRPDPPHWSLQISKETVALYEYHRKGDDVLRYSVEGENTDPSWEQSQRPICRVWRAR